MTPHTPVQRIRLRRPPCTIGVTDGSERGDYAPQSHLLAAIGRPHHVVNLMFQYYPAIEGWPTQGVKWHGFYRNNDLNKGDGYFPLVLEGGGRWGQEYLRQIADVRAHGQDPLLTLTLAPDTPDADMVRIARSLAPFGRMAIRINHECNGTWFHFNKYWSYKQVSDLFIRFHHILHEHAPEVRTAACWNGEGEAHAQPGGKAAHGGRLTEDQLAPMFRTADIASYDQYVSLHWGWPDPAFNPAKPDKFFALSMEVWWEYLERFQRDICELRGGETDVEVHEINHDADVVGDESQAKWVTDFYRQVRERNLPWLRNVTFYTFRDRGGLGLEREDVERPDLHKATPALAAYRAAIADPYFDTPIERLEAVPPGGELKMSWASAVDAEGLEFELGAAGGEAIDLHWPAGVHLLLNAGDHWQIKPAGHTVTTIAAAALGHAGKVRVFAPPPDGRNGPSGPYACTLKHGPSLRT